MLNSVTIMAVITAAAVAAWPSHAALIPSTDESQPTWAQTPPDTGPQARLTSRQALHPALGDGMTGEGVAVRLAYATAAAAERRGPSMSARAAEPLKPERQ